MPGLYRFQQRRLEWCIAFTTVWLGGFALLPPDSIDPLTFRRILAIMPETGWGVTYFCVGLMHCLALHVNIDTWWSPFVRTTVLFINSQVFLAVALAVWAVNPWGLAVQTYLALSLGFCGVAFYAAAADCGKAMAIWRRG